MRGAARGATLVEPSGKVEGTGNLQPKEEVCDEGDESERGIEEDSGHGDVRLGGRKGTGVQPKGSGVAQAESGRTPARNEDRRRACLSTASPSSRDASEEPLLGPRRFSRA
jgi:hypothetical protein